MTSSPTSTARSTSAHGPSSISHVLWASGTVLPVARIAEMAHARGAILVVDGAQSAGAMPVDLAATGADVYAIPAQKWLLGPEGMGAVAVAPVVRDRLAPAYGGHFTFETVDSSGTAALVAGRAPVRGVELSTARRSSAWPARSAG